ncbi:MAG: MarR family transcriptional regulator [Actinomycetota bacterium]|nr:MarR family transcriptional regulator [Actinomycetota bacterium]
MTEPRWLTPEQRDAWIALVATTVWLPAALDAQLRRDAGLTLVEYQVLSWLSMQPDRAARLSDIAPVANMHLSHLSRVVTRLEQRDWVRREPDPEDGRATLATLTPAGWDTVVAAAPGHAGEAHRLVFDQLDASDTAALARIARSIVAAARPDLPLPPPTP